MQRIVSITKLPQPFKLNAVHLNFQGHENGGIHIFADSVKSMIIEKFSPSYFYLFGILNGAHIDLYACVIEVLKDVDYVPSRDCYKPSPFSSH